jgi:alkylhydroperoxidase family enzyme
MAAHTTVSQMAKIPDDVIESLRDNKPIKDKKLEALRKFTSIINETRGWPSKNEVNDFLAAGYSKEVILDIIVGTAMKVMSNYTNHITDTKIDEVFETNAWGK